MRFIGSGPSIPDDLLLARDQGRVIFFCGAGVSRARARLPDFFGLARSVVSKLGVDTRSPAYKLIQEAQEIDRRVGVSGIISADRVFGLLERDFSSRDIEEAVASTLRPSTECDLSAHNILLDLATTPEGTVQLVTTNFDRLFDDCGRSLRAWQPPRLPDPLRPKEMDGIVYLHGRSAPDYSGAEGDGFVLSSSEFGRAYLSDGWATAFIREILGRYVVVFVGYTADDPPVQYLLEALRKTTGRIENAYAFQSGDHDDAAARWLHKGVKAIPYKADNDHTALWQSLEAWAQRAQDSTGWYSKVIAKSKEGPASLQPHERGQVAHVVSTYEGTKRFCSGEEPPPAEWLCVFDRYRRFAKPGRVNSGSGDGPYIDPFDRYGLDFDVPPSRVDPEDYYAKREAPVDAWDAFDLNRLDRSQLKDDNLAGLRGHWATHSPQLVPRIGQLGVWLAKICDQPAAVWWAAHQTFLHSDIQERISWELTREKFVGQNVRSAWRSLFEAWNDDSGDFNRSWYELSEVIKKEGWSSPIVRQLGEKLRPRLSAKSNDWTGPIPPTSEYFTESIGRLVQIDVEYPKVHDAIAIPDDWCAAVVQASRRNLELALTLENEAGGYGLNHISPIVADTDPDTSGHDRTHGLSGAVIRFTELFSQLLTVDRGSATLEFSSWPVDDDSIFARLRIWAAGDRRLVSDADFGLIVASLSDAAFWNSYHQRDLLLALQRRWRKLSGATRQSIELRLLNGPMRWPREKAGDFERRKSFMILSRLVWLQDSGCNLSQGTRKRIQSLQQSTPEWKPKYGAKAAESLESRGGWVQTVTNPDELLDTPLSSILLRAKALSGRTDDFLVEKDPFAGFTTQRPVRALAALTYAAKHGDIQEWSWQKFLNSEARKSDRPRLTRYIGERLAQYPDEKIAKIMHPVSNWLRDSSTGLSVDCVPIFDRLISKLIEVLRKHPESGTSGIVRDAKAPDWTMESINSPTGKISEALLNDPRTKNLDRGTGFPDAWRLHIESLMSLPKGLRQHALVIIFHNLNWFYSKAPEWSEANLLPILRTVENEDYDAAWAGFMWGANIPHRQLYTRLKNDILRFATASSPSRRPYTEIVAGMVLAGWGTVDNETGQRYISDEEMRGLLLTANDDFRSQVLWQAQRWSSEEDGSLEREWANRIPELLRIWPRQISARLPSTSIRLCELAFSSGTQFPVIADLILPLLSRIERDHLSLPELYRTGGNIVDRYPEHALAILHAILPENAASWPYRIEETLQRIGEADTALNKDDRLIELRRRWNAR